ncbi:MAG: type III pantothenate kinase, partial [Candidatus Omnitrophica bacterium]|nr:type III pantothenate kinase [Candidatus Omnitrophota bacterium]
MLLLVDIGNSSTTFGISNGKNEYFRWYIPTDIIGKKDSFQKSQIKNLKKGGINPQRVSAVVICSVVPKLNKIIKKHCQGIFTKSRFFLISKDIQIPIKNKYKRPEQVGHDRLVNALAVKSFYRLPVLVVDFGTAITIDVVSKKGEYLGGVIVPGINLSLKILYENTALLPLLNPRKPKAVLGKDTENSILSGIFYGYSFLVDGLIKKLKTTLSSAPLVVATGGNLKIMKPLCREVDHYQPNLTLIG